MQRLLLTLGLVLSISCVATETPIVLECGTAAGTLTVLPSLLEGAHITKASWRMRASTADLTAHETIVLSTTLRADRKVDQSELALLFDAPGAYAVVDNAFVDEGAAEFNLSATRPLLEAGAVRTTVRYVEVAVGFRTGAVSRATHCPRTVRVVPRHRLALLLSPVLATTAGQEALVRRQRPSAATPLVVVMDTIVHDSPGSTLLVGAAVNTADSAVSDMVVGLVTTTEPQAGTVSRRSDALSRDTLEYFVGTVEPQAVAPFAGGSLNDGERIIKRVTYRLGDVRDRLPAGEREMHRASEAGRAIRIRARRRADCAAGRVMCAQ